MKRSRIFCAIMIGWSSACVCVAACSQTFLQRAVALCVHKHYINPASVTMAIL